MKEKGGREGRTEKRREEGSEGIKEESRGRGGR